MSQLEFRNVTKHYVSGDEVVKAVDGVSLTVSPGEFVAMYGPSGSGKTTLLLLAAGVLVPDRGQVRFNDVDIQGLSRDEVAAHRRSVGVVFQSFHLMPKVPAVDNATLKLLADGWTPPRAREQAAQWLERVGLSEHAHRPPERLSQGQRQRVAIARALANEPKLVLADEPTGNLDTQAGNAALALIAEICRERRVGVLLATHDPEAARFADRIYDLRDGQLIQRADDALPQPAQPHGLTST